MNRVRQVSMVERDVADTDRVTESPKKLKPLWRRGRQYLRGQNVSENTHPMLIMIRTLDTAMDGYCVSSRQPSRASK